MDSFESRASINSKYTQDIPIVSDADSSCELWNYKAKSKYINMEKIKASNKLKVKKFSDAVYLGEIISFKRHGMGIMKYDSGRIYEGFWKNDLRDGKGYEIFPNGNIYEGDYFIGKPNGSGIFKWKDGEIYDGQWKMGLKHGDGLWKGSKGDSYLGEWKNSKPNGYGVHSWVNHDKYEGEFIDGLKHGHGTDLYANGDIFIGEFRKGKPYGYGQYIWKSGAIYLGNFENGYKQGMGKWKKSRESNSNQYDGLFFQNMRHGFGIYSWSSGNKYIGQFKSDERNGIGKMEWTDGSIYIGEWANGIQNGYGIMIYPDGTIKEGKFENNIFLGSCDDSQIPIELKNLNCQNWKLFKIENMAPPEFKMINFQTTINKGKSLDFDLKENYQDYKVNLPKIQNSKEKNRTFFEAPIRLNYIRNKNHKVLSNAKTRFTSKTKQRNPNLSSNFIGSYNSVSNYNSPVFKSNVGPYISSSMLKKRVKNLTTSTKRKKARHIWIPSGKVQYNYDNSKLKYK